MQSFPGSGLSDVELRDLRRIAGMMIPADDEFALPAADDPLILADIVGSLGRDLDITKTALAALAATGAHPFADLDAAGAEAVVAAFVAEGGPAVRALERVIVQCYYRDDRVLRSLGLEPRAPFPKGHTLEQGDWSLLDVVRRRPQLWRDDRSA